MKTTILITLALSTLAHAGDLYVYERQPNKLSAIHKGLANGVPVLIDIYGSDAIEAAHTYGRGLVLNHYPFAESKALIKSRAEQLYAGHMAMIRWFEKDAAEAYDAEVRKQGNKI
jgi:hypothetical protein